MKWNFKSYLGQSDASKFPGNASFCMECGHNRTDLSLTPASFSWGTILKFLDISWFQTFALLWMLYAFLWVIPQLLNFICRRFGTLCSIFIGGQVWRNILSCPGLCRGWSSTKLYPDKHGRGVLKILGPLGNVPSCHQTYVLGCLVQMLSWGKELAGGKESFFYSMSLFYSIHTYNTKFT